MEWRPRPLPALTGQTGSSAYGQEAPGQHQEEPSVCGPLFKRLTGTQVPEGPAGCFPLMLQLIQKLQDPSSLGTQGKKEEREEEKKEDMERCREREREREHGSVSGRKRRRGGGRKEISRSETKQFAKCRNKYSWLNSNPTGSVWGNKPLSKAKRFKGNWIYLSFT